MDNVDDEADGVTGDCTTCGAMFLGKHADSCFNVSAASYMAQRMPLVLNSHKSLRALDLGTYRPTYTVRYQDYLESILE